MAEILFANSGIALLHIPLKRPIQPIFSESSRGAADHETRPKLSTRGWQMCRCSDGNGAPARPLHYAQWQIAGPDNDKFFLAIDTTLGEVDHGYIRNESGFVGDHPLTISGILDDRDRVVDGLPSVDVTLRPMTNIGAAKKVQLVVDFGNSRTGALLIELRGQLNPRREMMPFCLINRYQLDAWRGEHFAPKPSAFWFSSRTCWCTSPYRPNEEIEIHIDGEHGEEIRPVKPRLFDDLSLVRLGSEAEDMTQVVRRIDTGRTGVSSPKRFLWAEDNRVLDGALWYMSDPFDRHNNPDHAERLSGALLEYMDENDSDRLLVSPKPFASKVPNFAHSPRVMMVTALYELLCQAYTYVNSPEYREATGDRGRPRCIHSLSLSFPSGMIQPERERFQKQAQKAAIIFQQTLAKHHPTPKVGLSIDEASAVHLTYIYSEWESLGRSPELFFSSVARDRTAVVAPSPNNEEEALEDGDGVRMPAGRRRLAVISGEEEAPTADPDAEELSPAEKYAMEAEQQEQEALPPPGDEPPPPESEVRIACIDIGGGTTDLVIGRYWWEPATADVIHGRMLHRDGISIAGDKLVKRLLERIIVPQFADTISLDKQTMIWLFGRDVHGLSGNIPYRAERIYWLNRMFVPMAHRYLQHAIENDVTTTISHTHQDLVDDEVLESLETVLNERAGVGQYNLREEMKLRYSPEKFVQVVDLVMRPTLQEFCQRIADYDTDVVLLAGQPSKLPYIQQLIRKYLPLHDSRIVPMHNYYAGPWYPYANVSSPGLVSDPKSVVVVGAGLKFLADNNHLQQFQFHSEPALVRYYWGIFNQAQARIVDRQVLLHPGGEDMCHIHVKQRAVILGRRLRDDAAAEAAPVYVLEVELPTEQPQKIDVQVRIQRFVEGNEELLRLASVQGKVGDEKAVRDVNVHLRWRTWGDEDFFLDTGQLDNIRPIS